MFLYKSSNDDIRRIHARNTWAANVFSFIRVRYNVKNKNRPYYEGSLLWDTLPIGIRSSENILDFKKGLSRIYQRYDPTMN